MSSTSNVRLFAGFDSVEALKNCGVSEEEFSNAIKEVHARGDMDSDSGFMVQLLISLVSYEAFVSMMQNHKMYN